MTTVLLVVHLLLALALIAVVLLQRSEGGGLGIGGGGSGGGMGGLMSGRGTANLLTRTTAVLAACFMVTSLLLTMFAGGGAQRSLLEDLPLSAPTGQQAPVDEAPAPSQPSVPVQ